MAVTPVETTARLWLDYRTGPGFAEHTIMIRMAESTPASRDQAMTSFLSVLQALGAGFFRSGWSVFAARSAPAGSLVSLPVAVLPALASFVGTASATYGAEREALEMKFIGRSLTGKRAAFSLFGPAGGLAFGSFRIQGAATGNGLLVRNAVAAINGAPSGYFLAVDGTRPIWYDYLNFNYNSYWERRIRIS